jgi:hypothetical protein
LVPPAPCYNGAIMFESEPAGGLPNGVVVTSGAAERRGGASPASATTVVGRQIRAPRGRIRLPRGRICDVRWWGSPRRRRRLCVDASSRGVVFGVTGSDPPPWPDLRRTATWTPTEAVAARRVCGGPLQRVAGQGRGEISGQCLTPPCGRNGAMVALLPAWHHGGAVAVIPAARGVVPRWCLPHLRQWQAVGFGCC